MNKRLTALLIAVMMLLSAFVFAGCGKVENIISDVISSTNDEEPQGPTPKQLFQTSLKNLSADTEGLKELPQAIGESNLNMSIDKFIVAGTDITQLGKIGISVNGATDKDGNSEASAELSLFGETVPFKAQLTDKNIYLVDFMGLNEKPLQIEMPEPEDITGVAGVSDMLSDTDKITAIIEHVAKSVETVINGNIDDGVFTGETKDVTILGNEFKGADVVTMTIDKEKLAKIASDFIDELMKNEDIKEMFGEDFDKEEALKELEDFKALRVVNTIVEEKSIALSIYVDGMAEKQSDDVIIGELAAEESEAEKEEKTFGLCVEFVGKNFALDMGFVNEEGKVDAKIDGAITLDINNDGSKFDMSLKLIDGDEEIEPISIKADIVDGEYKGKLYVDSDGDKLEVGFVAKLEQTEGKFGITGIKMTQTDFDGNATEIEIPLELTFNYKIEENKVAMDGQIKLSIEGTASIEASFDMNIEYKDVTVKAVTDSIPMEEFDFEGAMSKFGDKYPNINGFLNAMFSSVI